MDPTTFRPQSHGTSMATPQKKSHLAITSLLSPPESKRQDTFSLSPTLPMSRTPSSSFSSISHNYDSHSTVTMNKESNSAGLISPPVSPPTPMNDNTRKEDGDESRDPVLFPSQRNDSGVSGAPLFPTTEAMEVDSPKETIHQHIAARAVQGMSCPTAEEYALTMSTLASMKFTCIVAQEVRKDPAGWMKREMAQWDYYKNQGPQNERNRSKPKGIRSPAHRKLAPKPEGIAKMPKTTLPRLPPRNPKPKRTPVQEQFVDWSFPQKSPSLPKAPRPATTRDDMDFTTIEDRSPPLSTIPNNSKALKIDWKGQMLDLSNDPHRKLLHEAEIHLASTLRLTCAMYLTSKRRIFVARINALRIGKEFRKTDAQQACKIDVNKASKLWTAFDKVDWFNPKWFTN